MFALLLVVNIAMYLIFTSPNEAAIIRFLQRDIYGRLYWSESFFILKISLVMAILFLTEILFENPQHDTVVLMRFHTAVVFLVKLILIAVMVMLKSLFLFVLLFFIYTKTPFYMPLSTCPQAVFKIWLWGLRTLTWMVLVMVITRHKGWLLLLFFCYLLLEIVFPFHPKHMDLGQSVILLFFSHVTFSPSRGFMLWNNTVLNLFISLFVLSISHRINGIEIHK